MLRDHGLEDRTNLSLAWGRAIRRMLDRGGPPELAPVVVSVDDFDAGVPREDEAVRRALDTALARKAQPSCETVANTIFPAALWNKEESRQVLFERYERVLPKLKRSSSKNRRGMYFERMITGGPPGRENQLDFIISNFTSRPSVRRGALQVSVFDARRDQTPAALAGFPCLQHVTFAPTRSGGLQVNGFYATQYAVTRAYGNYLGLCRLGRFVAHELGLRLEKMTCFTGIMLHSGRIRKSDLANVVAAIDHAIEKGS